MAPPRSALPSFFSSSVGVRVKGAEAAAACASCCGCGIGGGGGNEGAWKATGGSIKRPACVSMPPLTSPAPSPLAVLGAALCGFPATAATSGDMAGVEEAEKREMEVAAGGAGNLLPSGTAGRVSGDERRGGVLLLPPPLPLLGALLLLPTPAAIASGKVGEAAPREACEDAAAAVTLSPREPILSPPPPPPILPLIAVGGEGFEGGGFGVELESFRRRVG